MTPPTPPGGYTLDVVVAILLRTEQAVTSLNGKIDDQRAEYVSSAVWVQRNTVVDNEVENLKLARAEDRQAIADLRAEVRGSRAPWWTWAALLISGAAAARSFFGA